MNVLVTGSNGFIGRNLVAWLGRLPEVRVLEFDQENTLDELGALLAQADIVCHLAGVNRPQTQAEFTTGNVDLTSQLCDRLLALGKATPIVLSSSIQAELDNPYGVSKRQAEAVVADYAPRSGAQVVIYRLKNVFGKWCRPNYNSVVATFCYNIAHDQPITISDPARELELVHVDDVVEAFVAEVRSQASGVRSQGAGGRSQGAGVSYKEVAPGYGVTLGRLAELIRSFRAGRQTLQVPDFSDAFTRKLYGTFLSYLEPDDFAYHLTKRTDPRGRFGRIRQVRAIWTAICLTDRTGHHARQPLPSHEDREVSGGGRRGGDPVSGDWRTEHRGRGSEVRSDRVLRIREGLQGCGYSARVYALDRERRGRGAGDVVLGERGV